MLVIVDETLDLAGDSLRMVRAPRDRIPGLVLEAVGKGEKVLAVYKGAWSEAGKVWARARAEGLNHLLYRPLDPAEAQIAGVPLDAMVRAWYSAHAASRVHQARQGLAARKKVSRRVLFRLPAGAARRYEAPILVSPEACMGERHCRLCLSQCPYNALEGKPPSINLDACTYCGACTWHCPYGLLVNPWASIESLEYLFDHLSRHVEKGYALYACRNTIPRLIEVLEKSPPPHPTILIDVECPGWAGPRETIAALARGLHPVVYCTQEKRDECGVDPPRPVEGVPWDYIVGAPEILISRLTQPPAAKPLGDRARGAPETIASIITLYGVERSSLSSPLTGIVRVDQDKCMLCDACSAVCKFQALKLEYRGDEVQLVFDHARCVACNACIEACPHDAISLEWAVDATLIGREKVLARDELARCKRCGRPLGSMKMIGLVVENLEARGVPRWVIDQVWLCPSCKLYGVPKDKGGV